jgi:hypothetical protein
MALDRSCQLLGSVERVLERRRLRWSARVQCLDHGKRVQQALLSQYRQWNQRAAVRPNFAKSARKTGDFVVEIQVRGDNLTST